MLTPSRSVDVGGVQSMMRRVSPTPALIPVGAGGPTMLIFVSYFAGVPATVVPPPASKMKYIEIAVPSAGSPVYSQSASVPLLGPHDGSFDLCRPMMSRTLIVTVCV